MGTITELLIIDGSNEPSLPKGLPKYWHIRSNRSFRRRRYQKKIMWDNCLEVAAHGWMSVPWNGAILDWFLQHQHLIPENLRGRYIIFEGTTYADQYGEEFWRVLFWNKFQENWEWTTLSPTDLSLIKKKTLKLKLVKRLKVKKPRLTIVR